jgi:hypothetical protein
MLPSLPGVVPMKAKLGENAGDRGRLLVGELNPNPLPNHFGQLEKARSLGSEKRKNLLGVQCPVETPERQIDRRSAIGMTVKAQLFGSAQALRPPVESG